MQIDFANDSSAVRLFVAVELDRAAKAAIAEEQRRIAASLRDARSSLKWVKPDQMHLTLVFLGEVPEEQASKLVDAVGRPVSLPPFEIAFAGLGMFPPHGAPHVLWIGATDAARNLADLQQEMASRAAACGVALESRPFHPHLTLGRWSRSRASDRRIADGSSSAAVIARVDVREATLFHSRLGPSGSTHIALTRATLSG